MSDRGGRGRGRGGGDGYHGGSRGGGRGGGDGGHRGGSRGGSRGGGDGGYRGGGRGGGDGHRDGSGNFHGSFSGFRGDGGGRGGRGGGGGGSGARDSSPGKTKTYTGNGQPAVPDQEITKLENTLVIKQTAALSSLTSKMSKMSIKDKDAPPPGDAVANQFPERPAFGSTGRPVVLWANYFRVLVKTESFFRYTLEVSEVGSQTNRDVRGRKLHLVIQAVLSAMLAQDPNLVAATEFKAQMITLRKLKFVEADNAMQVEIPRDAYDTNKDAKKDKFKVVFKGPFDVNAGDLKKYLTTMTDGPAAVAFPRFPDVMDALNIILGHGLQSKTNKIAAVGSSRFFPFVAPDAVTQKLTRNWNALIAARGYFQSARIATGRILLNTNVTHGVFKLSGPFKKILDDFGFKECAGTDQITWKVDVFGRFLPKTRVLVTIKQKDGTLMRRSKAIFGLASASTVTLGVREGPQINSKFKYPGPKNINFWLKDSKTGKDKYITVADYFRTTYNMMLGDYPVLNLGTKDKPTFYPAEVIEILPGQSAKARLTMDETTDMLHFACKSPCTNATFISGASRSVLGLDDPQLSKYGISVDKSLLAVQARVLEIRAVDYVKDNRFARVIPQDGSWNMKSVKVVKGGTVKKWTYVNIVKGPNDTGVAGSAADKFGAFMVSMGIRMPKTYAPMTTSAITRQDAMSKGALHDFFKDAKKKGIDFIVVVLAEKDPGSLYSKIKWLGDCEYGIHTSCMLAKQFEKGLPPYLANVGLKVNLKFGGVNHKLTKELGIVKTGQTMIVGYDVTHPTNMPTVKGGPDPPSLVGLVASINKDLGQWPAAAWEQTSRQEMLSSSLTDAFKTRLQLWKTLGGNAALPENIIIFRDGVSEGQFAQVLSKELPLIREACRQVYHAGVRPKLTIVVSVKRHQTRFYPTSQNEQSRSGNVMNGTVVDRGVTQVRYWDFFLTAHDALQGTARPAHYTVLLDEVFRSRYGKDAANELESVTHGLCYLFGRATKAVSICPPAYYADIVCERARAHRPEHFDPNMNAAPNAAAVAKGRTVHDDLKNSMYYI